MLEEFVRCRVGLLGKDVSLEMMVKFVRHGQIIYYYRMRCKCYVKDVLEISITCVKVHFCFAAVYTYDNCSPLSPPSAATLLPYSPVSSLPYSYGFPIDAARRFF